MNNAREFVDLIAELERDSSFTHGILTEAYTEALTALAGAAQATRRVELGTGIANIYWRHPYAMAMAAVGILPFAVLGPLVANQWGALVLLTCAIFFVALWGGPVAAGLQALTPNQMRAQVSALYLFSVNITGLALGPVMVGVFTDQLFDQAVDIKYSLALTGLLLAPPAIVLLIVGRKHFCKGVIAATAWER